MIEDEAKTKWCPMARIIAGYAGGDNSSVCAANRENESSPNCIGSACMMWRWELPPDYAGIVMHEANHKIGHGFCGLAGNP